MTGSDEVVCHAATLLLLFTLTTMPAKAQFAGIVGGGGGDDMMMQTMGRMMEGGGGEMMSMIPQLMRMANMGGSRYGRRFRRR